MGTGCPASVSPRGWPGAGPGTGAAVTAGPTRHPREGLGGPAAGSGACSGGCQCPRRGSGRAAPAPAPRCALNPPSPANLVSAGQRQPGASQAPNAITGPVSLAPWPPAAASQPRLSRGSRREEGKAELIGRALTDGWLRGGSRHRHRNPERYRAGEGAVEGCCLRTAHPQLRGFSWSCAGTTGSPQVRHRAGLRGHRGARPHKGGVLAGQGCDTLGKVPVPKGRRGSGGTARTVPGAAPSVSRAKVGAGGKGMGAQEPRRTLAPPGTGAGNTPSLSPALWGARSPHGATVPPCPKEAPGRS